MKCDFLTDGKVFKYSTCCFAKKWNGDVMEFNIKSLRYAKSSDSEQKIFDQILGFLTALNIKMSNEMNLICNLKNVSYK